MDLGVPFNINNTVWVRLTDYGRQIHRQQWDELNAAIPLSYPYAPPKEDAEGWSKWQLWTLMEAFGALTYMGGENCFETTIRIDIKDEHWGTPINVRPSSEDRYESGERRIRGMK